MTRTVRILLCTVLIAISAVGITYARSEYWEQRVSLFERLPLSSSDIVFLGNSITDGGEFAELLDDPRVKNRGISGDVISGVRERLDQIVRYSPSKIFLLIGINDISHNLSADTLAKEYQALIKEIRTKSPDSKLYIQAVMPINNDFGRYKNLKGKENVITELNGRLKSIASENGAEFLDTFSLLADNEGRLPKKFTNDGLHLTGDGYLTWAGFLKQYLSD